MILVTGATGFLGSRLLIKLLDSNKIKVRALYRNQKNVSKIEQFFAAHQKLGIFHRIEWIQADINDVPALSVAFENVTLVYHCAAMVSFDPADEAKLRKINIEGTANVVNLCLDFKVEKMLYVSSIAALGDLLPGENLITENTEWNPEISHSDYAISKFGGEIEVWRAQQEGLHVVVVNPGVIIGEVISADDWKTGSPSIFSTIAKSNAFYTNGTTGFISIQDVVSIMIQVMESNIKNEKFILVAENLSYRRLANSICVSISQKPARIEAKKWMTEIAWRLDWVSAKIFSSKRILTKLLAKSLHSTDVYDNRKIKNVLNYKFESIEAVIAEIGVSYQLHHEK